MARYSSSPSAHRRTFSNVYSSAVAAWKLGLSGTDPRTKVRLTSSNSLSRYASGSTARLPAVAGHNDGYSTSCPGAALSALLPEIRATAARLQGRAP